MYSFVTTLIKDAIAYWPPVLLVPFRKRKVAPVPAVTVICPVPYWTMLHVKRAANPAGIVNVIADEFVKTTIFPLSLLFKV
jgi:hypothetical protein